MLCNMTILSEIHYSRFVLFVKNRKRAAPPNGGAARRISAQPEQRLHPQPELEFELDVPPTPPHEPQPHRRQHPQPVDAPATVPLCCVQVQVQVQVGFVVDVPPTEPVVCLQQGLQHRCWTKSGNVRPPKQPLQEEAILYSSRKRFGNVRSRVILCRMCPMRVGKQKNPDGTRSSGFWIQKSKENSTLGELRRAASCLQAVLKFFDCHFPLIFWAFLPFRFSVVLFLNHKNRCFLLLRFKLQSLKNVSHNTIILKQSNSKTLFPSIF